MLDWLKIQIRYIESNLLLLKENYLKTKNKVYSKCFQYTIKLYMYA